MTVQPLYCVAWKDHGRLRHGPPVSKDEALYGAKFHNETFPTDPPFGVVPWERVRQEPGS